MNEKASLLKDNSQERISYFPAFSDSEVFIDDQWTTSNVPSLVCGPVCVDTLTRSHVECSANSARSPEEEYPSLSATPSVATGMYSHGSIGVCVCVCE